jgi:hypothetical protein
MKLTSLFKIKNQLFLILIVLFTSCSTSDSTIIPDNVLSKEEMAGVLADVHILEAAMNLNISNAIQSENDNREETVLSILKKNGVTKEKYEESFRFYSEHPKLFAEVYKLILSNLSELQAKTANEKDTTNVKDSAIKDSIKPDPKKLIKLKKIRLPRPKP